MKKIFLILTFFSIISCKKDIKLMALNSETAEINDPNQNLYGNWVGSFVPEKYDENASFIADNKINIVIKKIDNNKVFGQSIVAGNIRNLEGELKKTNNKLQFALNEPGNDKNDGKFKFEIAKDSLKGKWIANNAKLKVSQRSYALVKQKFVYNPKVMLPKNSISTDYLNPKTGDSIEYTDENNHKVYYEGEESYRYASEIIKKLNASTTLIKEKDLKNLKKLDLEILRNTIFARHGYSFKNQTSRQFFDHVDWYIPVSTNVSKQLTPLEKINIALLERFEKYATDNYMSFGR
jgi:hypothetical protein